MKKLFAICLTMCFLTLFAASLNSCQTNQKGSPATSSTTDLPTTDSPITDFYYQETGDNGIAIIQYRGTDEHVVIPSQINDIPVTVINTGAFRETVGLKSIVIPQGVTTIEGAVFTTCTSLTSIVVKEGNPSYSSHDGVLYSKDGSRLVLCPAGKQGEFVVPDSVRHIEDYAFYCCTNLKSVTISLGVEDIGTCAFGDCRSLTDIRVNADNKLYASLSGVLYNKDQTQLIAVPGGKAGTFEVPDSVTGIGAYAFSGCEGLTAVRIPDCVQSIEEWAFRRCSGMKDIRLPNGIKEIPQSLFNGCTSLINIVIPASVTKIDDMAFYKCANLSGIELPSGLLSIGSRAFFGCTSLSEIMIPENVETMGAVIFQDCTQVHIYVKQESQPAGWNASWNHMNFPVVWGYTG